MPHDLMKPFGLRAPALGILAAAAVAVALPAQAAVFAQFTPLSGSADYKWIQNGTGGEFISVNSTGDTTAQGVATDFSFLTPTYAALAFLPTTFTIDATAASGNPAIFNPSAGTWAQTGLTGSFHFTYAGPTTTIGTFHLVTGENLLSGNFTNAWIQGAGGSGSTNVSIGNGGSATYHSAVFNFSHEVAGSEEFAFNLLGVTPHFGGNAGAALNGFTANGGGNFSAVGVVPEPASWALMILGFGGVGAILRRHRRAFAAA